MAPTKGKLEGRVTVPTGGWTGTINEATGGGAQAWTIAAGDYYMSSLDGTANDFIKTWELALETASFNGYSYTATVSAGEDDTGLTTVTRASGSGSITIAWTDTEVRDILGFATGTQSGSGAYSSTEHVRSLWLPDVEYQSPNGPNVSRRTSDLAMQRSGAGHVYALSGQRAALIDVNWPALSRAKTWAANEGTPKESWEQFWIDVILGEASWSSNPAGPFRWYPDADTDATYFTVQGGPRDLNPQALENQWTGLWQVQLTDLAVVPS